MEQPRKPSSKSPSPDPEPSSGGRSSAPGRRAPPPEVPLRSAASERHRATAQRPELAPGAKVSATGRQLGPTLRSGECREAFLGSQWGCLFVSLPGRRRRRPALRTAVYVPKSARGRRWEGLILLSPGLLRRSADRGPRCQNPVTVPCSELGLCGPPCPFGTVSSPNREVGGGQRRARPSEDPARGPFEGCGKGTGSLLRPWV